MEPHHGGVELGDDAVLVVARIADECPPFRPRGTWTVPVSWGLPTCGRRGACGHHRRRTCTADRPGHARTGCPPLAGKLVGLSVIGVGMSVRSWLLDPRDSIRDSFHALTVVAVVRGAGGAGRGLRLGAGAAQARIAELEARLGHDSTISSIPPSADSIAAKS